MKLKEILNEKLSESFANEIEQIADEFAIGFAEWKEVNQIDHLKATIQELLEIYKKEKGLWHLMNG